MLHVFDSYPSNREAPVPLASLTVDIRKKRRKVSMLGGLLW